MCFLSPVYCQTANYRGILFPHDVNKEESGPFLNVGKDTQDSKLLALVCIIVIIHKFK